MDIFYWVILFVVIALWLHSIWQGQKLYKQGIQEGTVKGEKVGIEKGIQQAKKMAFDENGCTEEIEHLTNKLAMNGKLLLASKLRIRKYKAQITRLENDSIEAESKLESQAARIELLEALEADRQAEIKKAPSLSVSASSVPDLSEAPEGEESQGEPTEDHEDAFESSGLLEIPEMHNEDELVDDVEPVQDPSWIPGEEHPKFNIVKGEEEGVWEPAPGYAWDGNPPSTKWVPGIKHPTAGLVSSLKEGDWV